MRAAKSDEELDERTLSFGDFGAIKNVAKREHHFAWNYYAIEPYEQIKVPNALVCCSQRPLLISDYTQVTPATLTTLEPAMCFSQMDVGLFLAIFWFK